jgi:S1-C subfamily serine protease
MCFSGAFRELGLFGLRGAPAGLRTAQTGRIGRGLLRVLRPLALVFVVGAGALSAAELTHSLDSGTPYRPASDGRASAEGSKALEVERLMAAVVRIEARGADDATANSTLGRNRLGTGVVIDERTVLTIGYLILETERVDIVTAQGRRIPATSAGYDHQTGFGLVRALIPLGIAPLELGDSDAVGERSRVLTLGQGEREITELMVVSRKPFSGSWEYLLDRPFFTFPPVNNWSGAALFGRDGRLIGIGSMVVQDAASDRGGVPGNLYVPVNLVKPILADLQTKGRRSGDAQPWLGVHTETLHGNLIVTRVQSGSPAERAGVSTGSVIVSVAGQTVSDREAFYRAIRGAGPAGSNLGLRVLQQGSLRDLEIQSIDRADFLARSQRGRGI